MCSNKNELRLTDFEYPNFGKWKLEIYLVKIAENNQTVAPK